MTSHFKKYAIFGVLALLFIAPGLSAFLLYQHPNWLSQEKVNKGKLLTPPVLLDVLQGQNKWKIIFWSPTSCKEKCLMGLDKMARIRLALGRKLYQVDQFLVLGSDRSLTQSTKALLKKEYFHWTTLSGNNLQKMTNLSSKAALFLASPDNYLILSYKEDVNPDDVYRDLKLLINSVEQKNG